MEELIYCICINVNGLSLWMFPLLTFSLSLLAFFFQSFPFDPYVLSQQRVMDFAQ